MTDSEKVARCISHIKQCHDALDEITVAVGAMKQNEDGDFCVSPREYLALHALVNQVAPQRPTQAK